MNGYISPPKSSPQLTKRPLAPQDQLAGPEEETVRTVHPVAIATSTVAVMMAAARRILVHPAATGRRMVVLDVAHQGSERILNGLSFLSSSVSQLALLFCRCHSYVLMYAILYSSFYSAHVMEVYITSTVRLDTYPRKKLSKRFYNVSSISCLHSIVDDVIKERTWPPTTLSPSHKQICSLRHPAIKHG